MTTPLDDEVALLAHVERLERRVQRDRTLALGVLALLLVTASTPAPAAPSTPSSLAVHAADGASAVIDGSGLSVASAAGTKRFGAGIDTTGAPAATEFDTAGQARQTLFLFQNGGPALSQYDAAHVSRAELYLADNGAPTMHLYNPQGIARLAFFIGDKGVPEFNVRNSRGVTMGYMSDNDQGGYVVLRDPTPATRAYIGQYTDGTWGIDVRNSANQDLFKKP